MAMVDLNELLAKAIHVRVIRPATERWHGVGEITVSRRDWCRATSNCDPACDQQEGTMELLVLLPVGWKAKEEK